MVQILEFWFEKWGQRLGEDLEQALLGKPELEEADLSLLVEAVEPHIS